MAGLGSRPSITESHNEAADLGEHRNRANGQGEQGGGKVRCQEECGTRSMIHQGVLSRQGTEFGRPCHFTGKAPPFSSEPRTKTANSSQVSPEKCQKSAEISGIGAIAPFATVCPDDPRSVGRNTPGAQPAPAYPVAEFPTRHPELSPRSDTHHSSFPRSPSSFPPLLSPGATSASSPTSPYNHREPSARGSLPH